MGATVDRDTFTLPEVAERMGISRGHAWRLVRDGKFPMPTIAFGTKVVVSKRVVERYLEGLTEQAS